MPVVRNIIQKAWSSLQKAEVCTIFHTNHLSSPENDRVLYEKSYNLSFIPVYSSQHHHRSSTNFGFEPFINDKNEIMLSDLNRHMEKQESYKKHMESRAQLSKEEEKYTLSSGDRAQLARVDRLAREYYDYYQEYGIFPTTSEKEVQIQSLSGAVSILSGIGLSFTEGSLATRLAALGVVAAIDGPLPVGDFIALVGAAVIIGVYMADYVSSTYKRNRYCQQYRNSRGYNF